MHRQPQFRKNAGNFGNLATAHDINILSLPTVAKAWQPRATAREALRERVAKVANGLQNSGNWQHVDIKGF
jgi:hypothetical protein